MTRVFASDSTRAGDVSNFLSVLKVAAPRCLLKCEVAVVPAVHAECWTMLDDVINPASPNIEAEFW